jgi:hypothetical protein
MATLEKQLAAYAREGNKVEITVEFKYPNDATRRPSEIKYGYKVTSPQGTPVADGSHKWDQ